MKSLLKKAERLALDEIKKYGGPNIEHFKISNEKGKALSIEYKTDSDVVFLGTCLMDLKIGQALKENRLEDHVKMSSDATKKFLTKEKAGKELIEKVIHCVEAHHGTIPYQTKDAEVVANADCYRFLTPRGVFVFANMLGRRQTPIDETIDYVEEKADEKWGVVSLPTVKEELGPHYKSIKAFVKASR